MGAGAQLSVTDLRRSTRHPVNFRVIGEHRQLGDVHLHIVNLSAHGFMAQAGSEPEPVFGLGRGERLVIRLPHVGRIEAHLIWTTEDRAGFQFERIIRVTEFTALVDALQPNPRLRARR